MNGPESSVVEVVADSVRAAESYNRVPDSKNSSLHSVLSCEDSPADRRVCYVMRIS